MQGADFICHIPNRSDKFMSENYKIGSNISTSPNVYLTKVTHFETGEKRLAKIISKGSKFFPKLNDQLIMEICIFISTDHPRIGKMHDYWQDTRNVYLIIQRFKGGSMFKRLTDDGLYSEAKCAEYMKQVFSVLGYLHEQNFVYRYLKLDNLVFLSPKNNTDIMLVNFSLTAKIQPGQTLKEVLGNPIFIAPEVVEKSYTEKCDLWSAGILLYIMLVGFPPFQGNSAKQIYQAIKTNQVDLHGKIWSKISNHAKDLVMRLLRVNPDERISMNDALNHPWCSASIPIAPNREDSAQIISNISQFRANNKLKKSLFRYISNHFIGAEEREEIFELFTYMDKNNNGTISRSELKDGIVSLFGNRIKRVDSKVDKIIEECDLDKSGELSYSEFATAALSKQKLLAKARLQQVFNRIDSNANGFIEIEELRMALNSCVLNENVNWEDLVRECDRNGDGMIDIRELISFMLKV